MAEFVEVMRKIRELCSERGECKECIMAMGAARICGVKLCEPRLSAEEIERRVAQWEAAKYPSWLEAWKQLFPESKSSPCPKKHFGVGVCNGDCWECENRPIPAEIAEKLGIRPREVKR